MTIDIYALYGPSGTGKSAVSLQLAHKYEIPAIIDDGLLIYNGKKVAGSSAKYENTQIQAVKRAIFVDTQHAQEVKSALTSHQISRLLILGTSKKMINKIVEALDLPPVSRYINISEVKNTSEIKAALYSRETEGKHVIPIPQIQVEKQLIRRIIDSVEQIFSEKKDVVSQRTIVMPRFQKGQIQIHENVLKKLVMYSCRDLSPFVRFHKIHIDLTDAPYAEVHVTFRKGLEDNLLLLAEEVQQRVYSTFEQQLNIELSHIHLSVDKLIIQS